MSFKTPDGAILHPQFSDRALVNVTPTTFVRKLLQENPDIPCRLLTSNNVMCVFKGMLAARPLKESKFPDIRAQYLHMLDRVSAPFHKHGCNLVLVFSSRLLTYSLHFVSWS